MGAGRAPRSSPAPATATACVRGCHPEADPASPLLSLAPCTSFRVCTCRSPHPGPVTNRDQGPFPLPCPAEPSSAESKPGARTCCPLANCRPGIQVAWPEALASQTPCPGSLGESEFVHQVPFSCPRAHSDSARHSTRLPGRRAEREGVSSAQWLGVLRLHAPGQEEKALTVLWAGSPFSLVTGSWLREAASALGFPLSSLLPAPPWAGGHPGRQRQGGSGCSHHSPAPAPSCRAPTPALVNPGGPQSPSHTPGELDGAALGLGGVWACCGPETLALPCGTPAGQSTATVRPLPGSVSTSPGQ